MSFVASLHLGYAFDVKAGFDESIALLADVPASLAHLPDVAALVPMAREHGRGVWRLELQAVGAAQARFETVYACRYRSNKAQGWVRWEPIEGVGNAQVRGSWQLKRHARHTEIELDLQGELRLELPVLLRPVVEPIVQQAFEERIERYIDHLIDALGGEA